MMIIGLEELLGFEYQYNVSCMDKKTRAMHYFKKIFPLGDLCKKLKDLATKEYVVFGDIVEQYIETNPEKEEDCREALAEFQKKLNNRFQNEE